MSVEKFVREEGAKADPPLNAEEQKRVPGSTIDDLDDLIQKLRPRIELPE